MAELRGVAFKDILRNAKLVERQTVPAHSGDWRGCKKSPWCAPSEHQPPKPAPRA